MSKKIYDCVATIREWIDPATGKKVKQTLSVGAIFESSTGRLVLKIDAMPTSPSWSGWLSLRPVAPAGMPLGGNETEPPKERPVAPAGMPPGQRLPRGFPPAPPTSDDPEDEQIPF